MLALARRIFPTVEQRLFAGTGHCPHLERPQDFVQILRRVAAADPAVTG